MPTLTLVRHGQASFGAADYDQLSALGQRQCQRLGDYFRARGRRFDAVITGTLARQVQSYDAIAAGLGAAQVALRLPGLNEYDSAAVIACVHPQPLAKPDTPALYRHHFRLLRQGLTAWMAGTAQPVGMPSYPAFVAGVADALDQARRLSARACEHAAERGAEHAAERGLTTGGGGDVLMVSSGGPIATAVGQVLGTPPEVTIELNMRIRNSAVTEFVITPKRHLLLSFNHLPHLDADEYADWVTYA